jgi:alkaline phosphatase D
MKSGIVIAGITVLSIFISTDALGKPPILTPKETPVMGELDPYLLEPLYKTNDRDTGLTSIVNEDRFRDLPEEHKRALFGGPMLGCVTDTRARIWVRPPGPAKVQAVVSKAGA